MKLGRRWKEMVPLDRVVSKGLLEELTFELRLL